MISDKLRKDIGAVLSPVLAARDNVGVGVESALTPGVNMDSGPQ